MQRLYETSEDFLLGAEDRGSVETAAARVEADATFELTVVGNDWSGVLNPQCNVYRRENDARCVETLVHLLLSSRLYFVFLTVVLDYAFPCICFFQLNFPCFQFHFNISVLLYLLLLLLLVFYYTFLFWLSPVAVQLQGMLEKVLIKMENWMQRPVQADQK